jgi:hypothetical protein
MEHADHSGVNVIVNVKFGIGLPSTVSANYCHTTHTMRV